MTRALASGSDRAISDALGFVLVFAIIIATVATVYVYGFQSLDDAREFERMNNAQRAFEVLADNVEDITQRGAPSRATEVKLAEAELYAGEPVTVNVTVERYKQPDKNASYSFDVVPIVYESRPDNRLVYSAGATFRASDEGATMATEPPMVLNDSRVVIPIVQTRDAGADNVAGSTTVLIRTERSIESVLVSNTSASSNVTVRLETSRAPAWRRHFNETADPTCPAADNNGTVVSCEFTDVDDVFVTRIAVDFTFE